MKNIYMKQKLIKEIQEYFGSDIKRINHALKVLNSAEALLKNKKADSNIVTAASILHDVGIKIAEEKYGSSAGCYQEKEGPAVARRILEKLNFNERDIKEICDIIAHHHSPGKIKSKNFDIVYKADCMVNSMGG